ncbi:Inactive pancreatic lipase-related protein 1 [Hypsibius exemplaris]|uniref:Inactive pancreatic lipase-related protein 1 n=1 Tax=Hypsibius exemplaris TaxID=2072580 RepID=A0A9X6RNN6_HYPEX|nr:Inactive pancreatic lipase-related protein 1 [Hypsibius exemplaris]
MVRLTCLLVMGLLSAVLSTTQAIESCCRDLGCFSSDAPFFHPLYRPVISVPKCSLLDTFQLHLNTRLNPIQTQVLDPYQPSTFGSTNLDLSKATAILIHGFTDLWDWPWWSDMVAAILRDADVNVIRLNWDEATVLPFIQSVADTRLAGAFVAKFINILKDEHGYNPQRIHIISHSLGVHAAAYAGERVDKVGRITGLDPGRLYFENTEPAVRLDPTDATVVDNIITDGENFPGFALGSLQQMGHISIYVNGGSRQPGCALGQIATIFGTQTAYNSTTYDASAIWRMTEYQNKACSHWRAFFLFLESIGREKSSSLAFECGSYNEFLAGNCFSNASARTSVGYYPNLDLVSGNVMRNFYSAATDRIPFSTMGFKLNFRLQSKTENSNSQAKRGTLTARIVGTLGATEKLTITSEIIDLTPGAEVSLYFHSKHQTLGAIQAVTLEWDAVPNPFLPLDWMRKHYIYLAGDLQLTTDHGSLIRLRPSRAQILENEDLTATVGV